MKSRPFKGWLFYGSDILFNPLTPGLQGQVSDIRLCRKSIILAQRRRGAEAQRTSKPVFDRTIVR